MTAGQIPSATGRPLPRGPHGLAREQVIESQRGRMIAAIAQSVAGKGYAATTVGDVVSGAGVSRKTFYEHFSDKEECFLVAWEAGVSVLFGAIVASQEGVRDPIERMKAGLRAYLETLAANPEFARAYLIEVVAAGPDAEARRADVHNRFAALLAGLHEQARAEHPELPDVPPAIFRAMVGATNELVADHVRAGRTEQLMELMDTIHYVQLALFAGHPATTAATR